MHPILFEYGDFVLPTFGVAMAVSMLFGIFISVNQMVREGYDEVLGYQCFFMAFMGVIVCAHLLDVIVHFPGYLEDPVRILMFHKGIVFYGGYIGAILFPAVFLLIKKHPILPIVDPPATYLGFGLLIHRTFGCFMAGCCFGKPTDSFLGVTFPEGSPAYRAYGMVAVYPTQLFEAALGVIMSVACIYWRNKKRKVFGELIALQMVIYGIGRFIIEIFRGDDKSRGVWGVISTSQVVSIIILILAAALWAMLLRRRKMVASGEMDPKDVAVPELPAKWW